MIKKLPLFFLFLTLYCTAQAPAIEWQKALGGTAGDAATAVQLTSDNGFIMAGYTSSNNGDVSGNNGGVEFWVVKISATGTLEWQKNYGGTSTDIARSIMQTNDGGYIVAGQTSSNNIDVVGAHGTEDCWVLKLDSLGNIEWSRAFGGSDYENTEQIIQTTDGGYIFSAYSSSINGDVVGNTINNTNFWIVKLSPAGTIEWQKIYGGTGSDHARCVLQTADGGYVIGGQTNSTNGNITLNHGNYDAWLIKLNNLGDLEWQKTYGGSAIEDMVHVRQTSDGGFVAAIASNSADGDVTGNHGGSYDYWIVKTDAQGTIEWQKAYGGTAVEVIADVKQTPDNGFVAFGQSGSTNGDVTGHISITRFLDHENRCFRRIAMAEKNRR
ncbi:hypothetical protein [Flavobacterium sp. 3HN19-14]|uniref:hypothetical protein n=1 Tax=Flavobacterium sp. 3HN19-14 TaxID=3448133 RepID=UPI003EE1E81F